MTSLLVLIPVSLGMGLVGLGAFFWALRHGQFEDPEGNAWRVIEPEDPPEQKGEQHGRACCAADDAPAQDPMTLPLAID